MGHDSGNSMVGEDNYRCGLCGGVHGPDEACDPPKGE